MNALAPNPAQLIPDPVLQASDPAVTNDLEAAVRVFRAAREANPQADLRLVRLIMPEMSAERPAPEVVNRVLDLLDALSLTSKLIPQLMLVDRYADSRTRARLTAIIARHHRNRDWIEERMRDSDSHVRASMVEAFLGEATPEAMEIFQRGSTDSARRVLANSALGYYFAGCTAGLPILGNRLANSADDLDRAAAAWAIGQTRDPRFLPILARLVRDADPRVRKHAFHSIANIRQAKTDGTAACELHFLKVRRVSDSVMHILFSARSAERQQPIRKLKPLDSRVLLNGEVMLDYQFQERVKHADPGIYDIHFKTGKTLDSAPNQADEGSSTRKPMVTRIELTIANSTYFGTHTSFWFGN